MKYLSNVILSAHHKLHILFRVIDYLLNVPQSTCNGPSIESRGSFLSFFVTKEASIIGQIPPLCPPVVSGPFSFNQREPVTLCFLKN